MSKRKADSRWNSRREHKASEPSKPDPSLFFQAHEADIVRGPRAHASALALEVRSVDGQIVPGEGLMRWQSTADARGHAGGDEDEMPRPQVDDSIVWVDRYDARLLLDASHILAKPSDPDRLSPTGWSDLPSDSEDTFFLSQEEIEDYHRDKRRRMIEHGREQRLKAMRAEDEEGIEAKEEDEWGGSDEEPDDAQKELIRRTAQHIMSSPNPAQLEMRILANHGADKRFAFLRGRWSRAWKIAKGRIRLEQEEEKRRSEEAKQKKVGLGGLSGYGDSDGSEGESEPQEPPNEQPANEPPPVLLSDEALKEARRARAREWAQKRRANATTEIAPDGTE